MDDVGDPNTRNGKPPSHPTAQELSSNEQTGLDTEAQLLPSSSRYREESTTLGSSTAHIASASVAEGGFRAPTDDDSEFPFVLLTPKQINSGEHHASNSPDESITQESLRDDVVADRSDFPFVLRNPDNRNASFTGETSPSPPPGTVMSRSAPALLPRDALHLGETTGTMIRPRPRSRTWPSSAAQVSDISAQALGPFNFVSLSDDATMAFDTPVSPVVVPGIKAVSASSHDVRQNESYMDTKPNPIPEQSEQNEEASKKPRKRGTTEMQVTDQEPQDLLKHEAGDSLGFHTPPPTPSPREFAKGLPTHDVRREKKIRGLEMPQKPGQHKEEK